MLRRLLIAGFAGTAMACALVGAPVAAQAAEPQWYANHNLIGTAHQQAIAWNEIELESGQEAYGKIHCTNVMNFTVWNEGGHGVGAFEGWGTNACKAPELEEFLELISRINLLAVRYSPKLLLGELECLATDNTAFC